MDVLNRSSFVGASFQGSKYRVDACDVLVNGGGDVLAHVPVGCEHIVDVLVDIAVFGQHGV